MASISRVQFRSCFESFRLLLLCLCLALTCSGALFADETEPKDEFLREVRALLEARGQDPVFGWAPGTLDEIIELLAVRLDHAHIVPTTRQLEDLRTSFRKGGAPQPIPMWAHPTTRRRRTAEIVHKIEVFLTSQPADPEQQEAARKQAADLIAKWTDDLAAREPDAAEDIR
jgi:hypothetical protein